jgi:glycosyltransferase involved in cell wall biosynthesis
MRRERPQIVHTHTAMAGCLGRMAAKFAGVPIIIHTFHGNSLTQYFSPFAARMFLLIERLLALHTDAILVLSQQQLKELSTDFRIAPKSRFRIVPLGLDLAPFLQISQPQAVAPIKIGWFGRLVDIKNIRLLLEIVIAAQCLHNKYEFHIAGDGPNRCLVEETIQKVSGMVWHGWVQDISQMLANCDLLIQTSRNEGTPVALIQGMASGRPFLSTSVGGVVDMVCGKGEKLTNGAIWYDNAVLVDPRPDAFVRVLDRLASNPQIIIKMGQAARSFANSHYRKEALVENLDALYKEMLHRKLQNCRFRKRSKIIPK